MMIEKTTTSPVHAQALPESDQVAVALSPRKIGPLLEGLFPGTPEKSEAVTGRERSYVCRILDTKYEPGSYCMILYQLGNDLVTGLYRWDGKSDQTPEGTTIIPSLGMRVSRFPDDPVLPNLPKALDPRVLSSALGDALPEFHERTARILRCEVSPLRFRPGRRCTVRLSLWLREMESGRIYSRVLYGKIYHDLEKARHVYEQMLSLSSAAPVEDGPVSFAKASAFLPGLAMVLQEPVRGTPLDGLINCTTEACDPRAIAGILAAASALAALHNMGLEAGKPRSISSELARFEKRGSRIGQVNPALGGDIVKLAQTLSAWLGTLDQWGARTCLVHGDCKPSQFLINGQRAALLDFDHCGMADPAVDLGTFLATLQQMQVKQTLKDHGRLPPSVRWLPDLKRQFLEAYGAASGDAPVFWQRTAWYEAVALLRKAIRGFERSPFSPLPAALVAEARKGVAALPAPFQS